MTKSEARQRIEKLLSESALGERWSFTDQVLAIVDQIGDAVPTPAAAAPTTVPLVSIPVDDMQTVWLLLDQALRPLVRYTPDALELERGARAQTEKDIKRAQGLLGCGTGY